jgi:hypothetical protein
MSTSPLIVACKASGIERKGTMTIWIPATFASHCSSR